MNILGLEVGSLADWFSAVGTILAFAATVFVYFNTQIEKVKINTYFGKIIVKGYITDERYIQVYAVNKGHNMLKVYLCGVEVDGKLSDVSNPEKHNREVGSVQLISPGDAIEIKHIDDQYFHEYLPSNFLKLRFVAQSLITGKKYYSEYLKFEEIVDHFEKKER